MITSISNSNMLQEMESMKIGAQNAPSNRNPSSESFGNLFSKAIQNVNQKQLDASDLTKRFVSGESGISAADVMQLNFKSEISTETLKQVRNKLLEEYKEILNTQL